MNKPHELWRGEVCKRCGGPNHIGYHLEDDIWNEVSEGYNILCINCLDVLATDKGIDWYPHLIQDEYKQTLYPVSTLMWENY